MSQVNNDFSKSSMSKNIIAMGIPMIAAQLVNILYSVVDRMYIGRIPGTGALALTGLGVALPMIALIMAFANLCGTGGGSLCSIYRGKGDLEEAGKVMGSSMTLLLILGVAIPLIFLPFTRPILYFFGASDATYIYAQEYVTLYTLGTPFFMIGLGMNPFINAQGFGRISMQTVTVGAVVNIILDPIFIFLFHMGIQGAAFATIIAQAVSAAYVLLFITSKTVDIPLRRSQMRLEARRVKRIISLGLSTFFMTSTNSLIQVVCNRTLYLYGGDLYVGAMTVVNAAREVVFMMVQGLNNGAQPVLSFNYGAGLYSRVREGIRFTMKVTIGYSVLVWLITMGMPEAICRIFTPDEVLIQASVPAMRIYFSMFILMALQIASQTVFVSLGHSRYASFFAISVR